MTKSVALAVLLRTGIVMLLMLASLLGAGVIAALQTLLGAVRSSN